MKVCLFQRRDRRSISDEKHILHCKHDHPSFEEFVFLAIGPMENGADYRSEGVKGTYMENGNKKRDGNWHEMMKAFEMIVGFPEFSDWKQDGKGALLSRNFSMEILGENFEKKAKSHKDI